MRQAGIAATMVLAAMLAASAQSPSPGWKAAVVGRTIKLPADHASHPEYKLEWWYYTGNVEAADAHRFGYQLTFFRVGLDPAPANRSAWAVRDLFMTHVALTDVSGRRYHFTDRMNRAGPGWAGATVDRYRVWNDDWEATIDSQGRHRLSASTAEFGIDLSLAEDRPVVLHGERGFSSKGSAAGNASLYYSLTRMPTRGAITIDGRKLAVTGLSWMDHEFGTSFLEAQQVGWDWFSIQLEDGRDLMLFQLRRTDGSIDPHSSGTLVDAGSGLHTLNAGTFHLQPRAGRTWRSPVSGARYPVSWQVSVPSAGLDLIVTAAVDDQELHTEGSTGVTYWEGAIDVTGQSHSRPVQGRGYLEMTGYAGPSMGTVLR
ncbi:MAG: lipocalin-like domain-containing protein [Vicinamibacterales bacterium]